MLCNPVGPSAMGLAYAFRPALLERVSEARGWEGSGWGRNQAEGGLHSPGALGTLSLFRSDVGFSGSQEPLLPQGFGFLSVAMLWLPSCCVLEQVIAGDTGGPETAQCSSQLWLHFRNTWARLNTSNAQVCPRASESIGVGGRDPHVDCWELSFLQK